MYTLMSLSIEVIAASVILRGGCDDSVKISALPASLIWTAPFQYLDLEGNGLTIIRCSFQEPEFTLGSGAASIEFWQMDCWASVSHIVLSGG